MGADPVVSYRNGAITIPYIEWIEPLRLECQDFANAIRNGTRPQADGRDGLEVVRILAAAQEYLDRQEDYRALGSLAPAESLRALQRTSA